MFSKLNKIWNHYGFEIMLVASILFVIIYGFYRKITGQKGTWSKQQYYSIYDKINNTKPERNRAKPKDSKGELECRRVLQQLFRKPFNKARPNFLRNPVTGGHFNLELDCFQEDIKIAVEYNGIQHYKFVPYFHKNKEAFLNQKYRDEMKRKMCKEKGILLIEVPYSIPVENIRSYLIKELQENGVNF